MPYNNTRNNKRNSGRFNAPGQFVAASENVPQNPYQVQNTNTYNQQNLNYVQQQNVDKTEAFPADNNMEQVEDAAAVRPHWMKSKLPGVKKISNKERRRRQNKFLRRLLTPKNALMVLKEMKPGEQILGQIKVAAMQNQSNYRSTPVQYCAELTLDGQIYRGFGGDKNTARNEVAELAIRHLMVQQLSHEAVPKDVAMDSEEEEGSLPMMQLASYALHRLFAEWEAGGVKVPQLRPPAVSVKEEKESGQEAADTNGASQNVKVVKAPKVPKTRELPADAATLHPCTLLGYMRPGLEYRDLQVEGDKPQNTLFTVGVEVDGIVYSGKAPNKKAARRAAARAACEGVFGVSFVDPQ